MKSTETYSLLKSELAPWFKAEGFKNAKALLSWTRHRGDLYTVVWCQVSQDGWDSFAGSKFTVELQRGSQPVVGVHGSRRARFARLLSAEEREEIRSIQNVVIAGLRLPEPNHPTLQVSQSATDWYLKQFEQVGEPYSEREDVWLRYASQKDVTRWAEFLRRKLPDCVALVEEWPSLPLS